MTMSCVGVTSGRPWAGDSTLLADSMSTRLSAWASADSGRCTAIWSPSKSALSGAHQRVDLDGLALDQHRLEGLDAQAVQRGRPVEEHRVLLDDLFEDVPHLRRRRSTMRLADLMFWASSRSTSAFMTNGLNSSSAICLGRPHWCSLSVGPTTMTDRPE